MAMMKRVARRVTLSLSESKRFTNLNSAPWVAPASPVAYQWSYRNIFAMLPTATGAFAGSSVAVDGNEIVDLLLKVKMSCIIPYYNIMDVAQSQRNYSTFYFHVYIIASNDYANNLSMGTPPPGNLAWSNYPVQYDSNDLGWFLQQDAAKPTLNGNNVRVIRRWSKKYTPAELQTNLSAGAPTRGLGRPMINFNVKHRFKGKRTFEDYVFGDLDSNYPRAGSLRGMNYYLLCGWGTSANIPVTQIPEGFVDSFLYFKDP